jgi:hypothetical protein
MIAAGRAGCDLTAFNDSDLQAAQRLFLINKFC